MHINKTSLGVLTVFLRAKRGSETKRFESYRLHPRGSLLILFPEDPQTGFSFRLRGPDFPWCCKEWQIRVQPETQHEAPNDVHWWLPQGHPGNHGGPGQGPVHEDLQRQRHELLPRGSGPGSSQAHTRVPDHVQCGLCPTGDRLVLHCKPLETKIRFHRAPWVPWGHKRWRIEGAWCPPAGPDAFWGRSCSAKARRGCSFGKWHLKWTG